MIRVFFAVHARVRGRLRETLAHPPPGVTYVSNTTEFVPDHLLSNAPRWHDRAFKLLVSLLAVLQIPHIRYLRSVPGDADCIHAPGRLLLNKKPYVIEIDNVGCLALYNTRVLYGWIGKRIIRLFLKQPSCKKLVAISEAARRGVSNTFRDDAITKKIVVVYPYVALNTYSKKRTGVVQILFNSTNFYLKGGREVLAAFSALADRYPNLRLTMVSRVPDDVLQRYRGNTRIQFVDASLDKETLYRDHYSQADMFVLPTYQDSFGLVFLEALAAGLPVIATRMAAVPEMVHEGRNGFLTDPPFPYFRADDTPNPAYSWHDLVPDIQRQRFPRIETFLREKIAYLLDHPEVRAAMGAYSRKLVEHGPFAEAERQARLLTVYTEAVTKQICAA